MRCISLKSWLKRLCSPVGIAVLIIGFVLFQLIGHHMFRRLLAHAYTPPALSPEKVIVYTKFVRFVEEHPEYKRIHLDMYRGQWMEIGDSMIEQAQSSNGAINETGELFDISRGFGKVGCLRAEKYSWYVVFIPKPNYIMPTAPGVLYSLDGQNPNDVDDKFLNEKEPFMHIKDHWYASMDLAACPFPLTSGDWSLPKSMLIDHSLREPNLYEGK